MKLKTCKGEACLPLKILGFLSFHKFHIVYISHAAMFILCIFASDCKDSFHQPSMTTFAQGASTDPLVSPLPHDEPISTVRSVHMVV
jgi:hypothetical protein